MGRGALSGFQARAGTLTLLFLATATERHVLLEMLAEMLSDEKWLELTGSDVPPDVSPDTPPDLAYVMDPGLGPAAIEPVDPSEPVGPHTVMRLTPAGREMAYISELMSRWQRNCPGGPLEDDSPDTGPVLEAVVRGWASTATQVLSRGPAGVDALARAIDLVSRENVEQHLEMMTAARLLDEDEQNGETVYSLTAWGRETIAMLGAAIRLETRHPSPDTLPAQPIDVEGAFNLALPLLSLPRHLHGSCRLAVHLGGEPPEPIGVTAQVEDGRVVSCAPHLDEEVETWAAASLLDWLDTLAHPSERGIEIGGDAELAEALVGSLQERLFAAPTRKRRRPPSR